MRPVDHTADMIRGLDGLREFLKDHPDMCPYYYSAGFFAKDVKEFLHALDILGEYEKDKSGGTYLATKHFGGRVKLTVYLEDKDAGTWVPNDPTLKAW